MINVITSLGVWLVGDMCQARLHCSVGDFLDILHINFSMCVLSFSSNYNGLNYNYIRYSHILNNTISG